MYVDSCFYERLFHYFSSLPPEMQVESDCLTELPSLAHTQLVCLDLVTPQIAALPPLPSTLLQRAAASQEELEAWFREAKRLGVGMVIPE